MTIVIAMVIGYHRMIVPYDILGHSQYVRVRFCHLPPREMPDMLVIHVLSSSSGRTDNRALCRYQPFAILASTISISISVIVVVCRVVFGGILGNPYLYQRKMSGSTRACYC